MELGNRTGTALEPHEIKPSNDDAQSETNDDDYDDTILKKGGFAVF